jgi:carbon monoxide dehydrogenase subunit G
MKISGSSVLHAPPEQVWAAITDPAVLSAVIPGCDVLTPIADNRFALTVTLGVASIKGVYAGEVSFFDMAQPTSLMMRANGSGGPGTIDTTVRVDLVVLADGSTRIDYDADAMVGGMVGGVGQRVLSGVAKKTARLLFAAIDDVLVGTRQVPAATPRALIEPIRVASPAPEPDSANMVGTSQSPMFGIGAPALVGAAVFGAISMLVGVLVGARITGRKR